MRQLFLLDNICSMHTSTVNKSYFIKDLACGPSLGLQNLMWPSGLKSLPTSALYSGYFGKNPVILGSRIIQICANIKLNKVVYIKLQNKSVYQYFFT